MSIAQQHILIWVVLILLKGSQKGGSSARRRSNGEQGALLPVEESLFHM